MFNPFETVHAMIKAAFYETFVSEAAGKAVAKEDTYYSQLDSKTKKWFELLIAFLGLHRYDEWEQGNRNKGKGLSLIRRGRYKLTKKTPFQKLAQSSLVKELKTSAQFDDIHAEYLALSKRPEFDKNERLPKWYLINLVSQLQKFKDVINESSFSDKQKKFVEAIDLIIDKLLEEHTFLKDYFSDKPEEHQNEQLKKDLVLPFLQAEPDNKHQSESKQKRLARLIFGVPVDKALDSQRLEAVFDTMVRKQPKGDDKSFLHEVNEWKTTRDRQYAWQYGGCVSATQNIQAALFAKVAKRDEDFDKVDESVHADLLRTILKDMLTLLNKQRKKVLVQKGKAGKYLLKLPKNVRRSTIDDLFGEFNKLREDTLVLGDDAKVDIGKTLDEADDDANSKERLSYLYTKLSEHKLAILKSTLGGEETFQEKIAQVSRAPIKKLHRDLQQIQKNTAPFHHSMLTPTESPANQTMQEYGILENITDGLIDYLLPANFLARLFRSYWFEKVAEHAESILTNAVSSDDQMQKTYTQLLAMKWDMFKLNENKFINRIRNSSTLYKVNGWLDRIEKHCEKHADINLKDDGKKEQILILSDPKIKTNFKFWERCSPKTRQIFRCLNIKNPELRIV